MKRPFSRQGRSEYIATHSEYWDPVGAEGKFQYNPCRNSQGEDECQYPDEEIRDVPVSDTVISDIQGFQYQDDEGESQCERRKQKMKAGSDGELYPGQKYHVHRRTSF
jgi:hypothetical protein